MLAAWIAAATAAPRAAPPLACLARYYAIAPEQQDGHLVRPPARRNAHTLRRRARQDLRRQAERARHRGHVLDPLPAGRDPAGRSRRRSRPHPRRGDVRRHLRPGARRGRRGADSISWDARCRSTAAAPARSARWPRACRSCATPTRRWARICAASPARSCGATSPAPTARARIRTACRSTSTSRVSHYWRWQRPPAPLAGATRSRRRSSTRSRPRASSGAGAGSTTTPCTSSIGPSCSTRAAIRPGVSGRGRRRLAARRQHHRRAARRRCGAARRRPALRQPRGAGHRARHADRARRRRKTETGGWTDPVRGAARDRGVVARAIGVASLANNHALNQGEAGRADTVQALQSAEVAAAFPGHDAVLAPLGVRVQILARDLGPGLPPADEDALAAGSRPPATPAPRFWCPCTSAARACSCPRPPNVGWPND